MAQALYLYKSVLWYFVVAICFIGVIFSLKSQLILAAFCWEILGLISKIKLVYNFFKDLGGKIMVQLNNSLNKADIMSGTYFILNVVLQYFIYSPPLTKYS